MSYSERLVEAKSEIDALVTYANETTGESDAKIGDAVGHLVEGYGGGGSSDTITIKKFGSSAPNYLDFTTMPDVKKIIFDYQGGTYNIDFYGVKTDRDVEIQFANMGDGSTLGNNFGDYFTGETVTIDAGGMKISAGNTGWANLGRRNYTNEKIIVKNANFGGITGNIALCANCGRGANTIDIYLIDNEITASNISATNNAISSDTIIRIADLLATYTDGSSHTINMGATHKSAIGDDKVAEIEAKGWTVS